MLWTLGVLIVLVVTSYFLIRSPGFQTWITQKIANHFADKLHTKITIRGVDIKWFKTLVLEGVYVEDLHQDTLLYSEKLNVDLKDYNLKKNFFDINECDLVQAKFRLKKYKGEKDLNVQFILDAFKPTTPDTTHSDNSIICRKVKLNDLAFSYQDLNADTIKQGLDFNHLSFSAIQAEFDSLKIENDTTTFYLANFGFVDKSGFRLSQLTASTRIAPNGISMKGLMLKTPYTTFNSDLSFAFEKYDDLNDFVHKVIIRSKIRKLDLALGDIGYFVPDMYGNTAMVHFTGDIRGKISQLKGRNLKINYGNNSLFEGNLSINGLPNFGETFMDVQVDRAQTSRMDLETFPVTPYDGKHFLELPSMVAHLGNMGFSGNLTGFITDFVAYGTFNTAAGVVTSDLNLKVDTISHTTLYSGRIATKNFELGKVLEQESLLGNITTNLNIHGQDFDPNTLQAEVTGDIASIEINHYPYSNIHLTGKVDKMLFSGDLRMKDVNADLDFKGTVDLREKVPVFDCNAIVKNLHLPKLGLISRDSSSELSSTMSLHFSGDDLDNLVGSIKLSSTIYSEKEDTVKSGRIDLLASLENKQRSIELTSDLLDVSLRGEFQIAGLLEAFKMELNEYIPLKDTINHKLIGTGQLVNFDILLRNTGQLAKIFFPPLTIASGTHFTGDLNSKLRTFSLHGSSVSISYNQYVAKDFKLEASSLNKLITATASCERVFLDDNIFITDVNIATEVRKDSVAFHLAMQNRPESPNKAKLNGVISFRDPTKTIIRILPSDIIIENKIWSVNDKNLIIIEKGDVFRISDFEVFNKNEMVSISGVLSPKPEDKLKVNISGLDLINFEKLTKPNGIDVSGILSGEGYISGPIEKMHITSNVQIDKLTFNDELLGTGHISTTWKSSEKIFGVDGFVVISDTVKTIIVKGQYFPSLKKDNIDISLSLNKIYLTAFNKYFDKFVTIRRGKLFADVHVTGELEDPLITGDIRLQQTVFLLNYLNTQYNFNGDAKIKITKDYIELENIIILDNNQYKAKAGTHQAIATGKIYHHKFKDFRLDVSLNAKEFQMLNTDASQNDMYYGVAYATGNISITGPPDKLNINVIVSTTRGTSLNIPISNSSTVGQNNFITFVNKGVLTQQTTKTSVNLDGILLDFELEITPDAEIQIIFDEKVGDKIKGRGKGNLRMVINTLGDFNIYGSYTIEKGDYLFTMQNVANKPFEIDKGGTVTWDGDALNAMIDLNATYKTRARLSDLIADSSESSKQLREIWVKMRMTNTLLKPVIKFDIEIPDVDQATNYQVKKLLGNNDAEINKQVFGLIVFGRFFTNNPQGGKFDPGISSNLSELLSSQLSNWASQISKNVELGFKYHPGDQLSREEMNVIFSTQILNDRVSIEGNVGVAKGQSSSNIIGDFNIDYKISKDGRLRLRTFNKTNNNYLFTNASPYTQGIGLFYRQEFDRLTELLHKVKIN